MKPIGRTKFMCEGSKSDLHDLLDDLKNDDAKNYITLAQKALLHLTWMCDNNDVLKNEFRICEGLKSVADFWQKCQHLELTGLAVFCLASAVSNNVESQKELCSETIFQRLCKTLSSTSALPKTKLAVVSLIIALVSQNETGHALIRSSGCLDALLRMFTTFLECRYSSSSGLRDSIGTIAEDGTKWLNNIAVEGENSKELWSSVVIAICASINNPQTEENQRLAARVLPLAVRRLDGCIDEGIVRCLTLLITNMLTNNVVNKRWTFGVRGLNRLMSSLTTVMDMDIKQRLELAVYHTRVINVYIDDNEEGVQLCGELNIVQLIVRLLCDVSLHLSDRLQLVITLSHCIVNNKMNRQQLIDCNGIAVLAKLISQTDDQQLSSIIKYILHICVNLDGNQKKAIDDSMSDFHIDILSRMESVWKRFMSATSSGQATALQEASCSPPRLTTSSKNIVASNNSHHSANSVVSQSVPPSRRCVTEHQLTSTPAVRLRRQLETIITEIEPKECTSKKVDASCSSDKTGQVIDLCQSTKHLTNCNYNRPPSPRKCVAFQLDSSSNSILKLAKQPSANSVNVGNSELQGANINMFKKPAGIPLQMKKSAEVMPSPKSVTANKNNVSFGQQPQLSQQFFHSSCRMVPSCAPSDGSQQDHLVLSNDTLKKGVSHNYKYLCSPREYSTSRLNSANQLGRLQSNGTASMDKVQSWLLSTSKFFQPNDIGICMTTEDQQTCDASGIDIESVKKGLRESVANVFRIRRSNISACPGCLAGSGNVVLNSQTYNITLETSSYTCQKHRAMRQAERDIAAQMRKDMGTSRRLLRQRIVTKDCTTTARNKEDMYDFNAQDRTAMNDADHGLEERKLTPPANSNESGGANDHQSSHDCNNTSQTSTRRRRIPYSEQEIDNLQKGVARHGKFWTRVLNAYKFHPSRTAIDLKDKYRNMIKGQVNTTKASSCSPPLTSQRKLNLHPFSMAEERRLKRGVRMFGYNWKAILASMQFAESRTAQELRNKWRTMHQV